MMSANDSVFAVRQDELSASARSPFSQLALREGTHHQCDDAVEPWTNQVKLGGAHNDDVLTHPLEPHCHV